MLGGPVRFGVALILAAVFARPVLAQPGPMMADAGAYTPPAVSLDEIPPAFHDRVKSVLDRPTLRCQGTAEAFLARAATYIWLLDNPDRAVAVWRMLGAQCADVTRRPDGSFGWKDDNGSDLRWEPIVRAGTRRVWYAEGKVKPALLLPMATVRALIVVHHHQDANADREGRDRIRHRVDFVIQTDSTILGLATRVMGHSAPKLAEQFSAQVQMFFGGLAWFIDDDTERARKMFDRLERSK